MWRKCTPATSVVRISRAEAEVKQHFGGMNADVYDAEWRSQFLSGMMQPLMNVVGNIGLCGGCRARLGAGAVSGAIEFGVIVAFILYVRLFTSPLTQIAQGMTNMQTASASARRIFDFLGSEELPDESDKPAEVPRRARRDPLRPRPLQLPRFAGQSHHQGLFRRR